MSSSLNLNLMANRLDGEGHHLKGTDKTMFKSGYRRPTDFGMQKYRHEFAHNKELSYDRETVLECNILTAEERRIFSGYALGD